MHKLERLRRFNCMSRGYLADMLNITVGTLYNIEHFKVSVKVDLIKKIMDIQEFKDKITYDDFLLDN